MSERPQLLTRERGRDRRSLLRFEGIVEPTLVAVNKATEQGDPLLLRWCERQVGEKEGEGQIIDTWTVPEEVEVDDRGDIPGTEQHVVVPEVAV